MHRFQEKSKSLLQKANEQLERTVREKTMELEKEVAERARAQEQFKETVEALKYSNRELEQFAYVASHDLQEPLRKILAFGDRLKQHSGTLLDEKGRDYLQRIQGGAERMKQLIEDILQFSQASTKPEQFEPVSLKPLIHDVLIDLEERVNQSGGKVEMANLPVLKADRPQMRQLFQNLIANALKFTRPGTAPEVRIKGRIFGNGFAEIIVEDNGIGFDEKFLDRIFQPFQRLHGRDEYEGTGMGLAICHKIVQRHSGTITARGTPGKGASFTVTLPVFLGE